MASISPYRGYNSQSANWPNNLLFDEAMMFDTWYNQTLGHPVDVDGVYGDQCVDIAESYCKFLWPDHNWVEELGLGNAKDLFNNSNPDYFRKINYSPGLIPVRGDLVVFGDTPTNPFGHIAVVVLVSASYMNVIEQNGFNPSGVAYKAQRPYINVIGFLRPKGDDMIETDDEAAEVIRAVFKREPVPEEITDLKGRNWYDALKLYRTGTAGQFLQAEIDNYDKLQAALDEANKKLQSVNQEPVVAQLDQTTKDQVAETNNILKKVAQWLHIPGF